MWPHVASRESTLKMFSGWGLKFLRFESIEQLERARLLHAARTLRVYSPACERGL